MAEISQNAPRFGWRAFVLRVFRTKDRALPRNPKMPKRLSPHIARDIGLSPDALERLHHRWPSEEHRGH